MVSEAKFLHWSGPELFSGTSLPGKDTSNTPEKQENGNIHFICSAFISMILFQQSILARGLDKRRNE